MSTDRPDASWVLVGALVAATVFGAAVAVHDHLDGRPLGIGVPWPLWVQALTWGTALSAPPVGVVLLCIAVATDSVRVVALLAATFLVGVLMEPNTWHTMASPAAWPARSTAVALLVVLPATMLLQTIRSIRRPAASR